MDVGATVQLDGEPSFKWENIGGVHYPNRGFMADMVRSKWMVGTIQKKSLGDQMNFITVPFSSTVNLTTVPIRSAL